MDVELEDVEEGVGDKRDCAIEFYNWEPVSKVLQKVEDGKQGGIPSSMPYLSSRGFPVSLQVAKGSYINSSFSFIICSPVSLNHESACSTSPALFWPSTPPFLLPPSLHKPRIPQPTKGTINSHASLQTLNRNLRAIMITRQWNEVPIMVLRAAAPQ